MALPNMPGMGGFPGRGQAGAGMDPQQLQEQQMVKFVSAWKSRCNCDSKVATTSPDVDMNA